MVYDVAVVGLGGIGSAALAHCAARGLACVGIEQFGPAHDLGSSHGKSRLIRKAYFEEPAYVPLLERSYDLWRALEAKTGAELLRITGLLTVGQAESQIITGTQGAARKHGLALESLDREEVHLRYPMLELWPDEVALFEADGGVIHPEHSVIAHQRLAQTHGAEIAFGVAMERWRAIDGGFEIFLADGSRIRARKLVLTLGPWFKQTLESLGIPIRIQRNVQAWFTARTRAYDAGVFPAFLVERKNLPAPLYGVPDFGDGLKAAFHGFGVLTDAQEIDREIEEGRDLEPLVRAMEGWMPDSTATPRGATACMYTLTPDEHFVLDRHPQHRDLILCGGFSGHGFKFAPVIGEIVADLASDGGTKHEIGFLSLRRFR